MTDKSQGFRVAGEAVSDAVGREFGRLIAERDALRGSLTIVAHFLEEHADGHRRNARELDAYGRDGEATADLEYASLCDEMRLEISGNVVEEPGKPPEGT